MVFRLSGLFLLKVPYLVAKGVIQYDLQGSNLKEDELTNSKESIKETIFKIKQAKELVKENMRK